MPADFSSATTPSMTTADTSPPRPSRYRSQRRPNTSSPDQASPHDAPPIPNLPGGFHDSTVDSDNAVVGSRSRYHRKVSSASPPPMTNSRPTTRDTHYTSPPPPQPAPPPQPDLPARYHHTRMAQDPQKQLYHAHVVSAQPNARTRTPPTAQTAVQNTRESPVSRVSPPQIPGVIVRGGGGEELDSGVELDGREASHRSKRRPEPVPVPPPAVANAVVPGLPTGELFPPPTGELFPPPTGELFPPPKPMKTTTTGHGPPRSDQIRATKSMNELAHREGGMSGYLAKFRRNKRSEDHATPPVPSVNKAMISRPRHTPDEPAPIIKAGGVGGIVPGTDAPISAVNAGDRRVMVEYGRSRNIFPVTPTTTSIDLIKSASIVMSEPIDVKTVMLLEYFGTVGVQRPLRRYERVRDVMNSWDHDKQNSLLLVNPGPDMFITDLSLAGVPKQKPAEAAGWTVLFSQKPGKWDKRYITLKPDGQMQCQKEAGKPKDVTNLCHLSDFDIYTPTQEKMKTKIKPPKKYCFAIKSQQKTSMFESTQDFVHFFSTGDKAVAEAFYGAVQAWRSWYLVNVLGEGYNTTTSPKAAVPAAAASIQGGLGAVTKKRSDSTNDNTLRVAGHRRNESTASHYQLGSFKPLFDMTQFESAPPQVEAVVMRPPSAGYGQKASSTLPSSTTATEAGERRAAVPVKDRLPPNTLKMRMQLREDEPLANLQRRGSVDRGRKSGSYDRKSQENADFTSTGLLGRQYSLRQREQAERNAQTAQPFTAGPNLLNGGGGAETGGGLRRNGSVRSSNDLPRRSSSVIDRARHVGPGGVRSSSDLQRSDSRRSQRGEPPRPLIDLTPQYREPPQHARKGRGYHPDAVGPGGLVDNATSPDDPLGVPSAVDWRAGRNRAGSLAAVALAPPTMAIPSDPLPASHQGVVMPAAAPFTGEGLLASSQAQSGWGGGAKGRGVIDGRNAGGKPMLQITPQKGFMEGSLLNRVEREQGGPAGPVIDREKRVERSEKTGEGFAR